MKINSSETENERVLFCEKNVKKMGRINSRWPDMYLFEMSESISKK